MPRLAVDPAALAGADAVLCQLEVPMRTVAAAAAGTPGGALFCLNTAPPAPVPAAVLDRAELVVANRAEFAAVAGAGPGRAGRGDGRRGRRGAAGRRPRDGAGPRRRR